MGSVGDNFGPEPAPPAWVLFDADGVVQGVREGWLEQLTAVGGVRGQEFVLAVFAAEKACATGADFGAAVRAVLDDFGIGTPLAEVFPADYWIVPDREVLGAVAELRTSGVRCGLATTQSNLRGQYMRSDLGYAGLFDAEFYSYEIRHAKPDPSYFKAVLDCVGVPPESVLFLDDHEANVAGAQTAGMRAELFPTGGGIGALRPILARHGLQLPG